MKIGILTFHRAINYGAVLQAYALQETLKQLGHDPYVIDYRQKKVENYDRRPFSQNDRWKLLKAGHLRGFILYNNRKIIIEERRNQFDNFLHQFFNLTDSCNLQNVPSYFDAYIVGSDQVWNSRVCDGIDPVFWGRFHRDRKSKLFSYAASTSVKDLKDNYNQGTISYLHSFDAISVREEAVADYLNQFEGISAKTVLDPTLLADRHIWDQMTEGKEPKEKYVLYFGARPCPHYPSVLEDKANNLAQQLGCSTKKIEFGIDSPDEFVRKIKYASYVVTSSFHGVAFSLIFNRPLLAVQYGDEQDARYVNVLKTLGAGDALTDIKTQDIAKYLDYTIINNKISEIRTNSIQFLKRL